MAEQEPKPKSLTETLGEEITRIVTPISLCMLLVVLLVSSLNSTSSSSPNSFTSVATIAYAETPSDTLWNKFKGALLNSLAFIAVVTIATFVLVLLFYWRCIGFLKSYLGFSAFVVLGFLGGEILLFCIQRFDLGVDVITFVVVWFNFTMVGVYAVFHGKGLPILVTQGYLVLVGVIVAYWFTMLPEWTTWVLLVAMALYDLAAVLLPGGPLRLLVELAIARDEEIPALVYEARPVIADGLGSGGIVERRVWRQRMVRDSNSVESVDFVDDSTRNLNVGEVSELEAPLMERNEGDGEEGIGLGTSGAIKLGLGDFIFYSVLVGRAAMYDFMTVYACYLAIIAGLGVTLLLLVLYRKALPALPVSISLGLLFYFLTRLLLEAFVVECSVNLIMF
ncbi:Presenilin-like protein [Acorus calamus]|uniref:Presenilin n=1 Tax=Acorus calamus TaxID=4465 RepID=A0AAV9ER31_ACOCL|nr:Presenilin-like protein [Acorus calamus]